MVTSVCGTGQSAPSRAQHVRSWKLADKWLGGGRGAVRFDRMFDEVIAEGALARLAAAVDE
ncbi:MAG TPA: hypothetical protein VHS58_12435, partial [Acetobacteraceae bacterium]|nr:hypothetical protein [Acetobacteraceae bacterium]